MIVLFSVYQSLDVTINMCINFYICETQMIK